MGSSGSNRELALLGVMKMANTEGPGGQPPAAWVWSAYRGVLPTGTEASAATKAPASTSAAPGAAPTGGKHGLIGLGLAVAVIIIAGLTWLFTTKTASGPASDDAAPATTESAPQKSEAAPPAPEPTPAAAEAPAPATPAPAAEAPKAAPPAPAHPGADHGKKKKKHQG